MLKTKSLKSRKKRNKFIATLSTLRKNLADTDEKRLQRLREAKDSRNIKHLMEEFVEHELRPKILTSQQRMAIALICDFVHNFSDKYIYTRVGVSSVTYFHWKNDPYFIRELDKEITRRQNFIRAIAFRNVFRSVKNGSMKDTWKYLEMTGDLRSNLDVRDRTGEDQEMSDEELQNEISTLSVQLKNANKPSSN